MFEFRARLDEVLIWFGVFDERGGGADFAGEEAGGFGGELQGRCELCEESVSGASVDVPGGAGGGFAEFCTEVAHFGEGMREQPGDLGFERACVDDLAERGIGGERQQVAGDVEGAGLEGALVGLGLHRLGARDALAQGFVDGSGGALVGGEEILDGVRVEFGGSGIGGEVGKVPAGFLEVLIAGGAFLAVPALFVDQDDGGQQAQALDGEGDVGQVGDGAVAVLEIKGVEELLGALGADLGEGFAHGERGARILGHGVGQDLGIGTVNGVDISLVMCACGRVRTERFTGHGDGLATRIRHQGRPGCASLGTIRSSKLKSGSARQNAGDQIADIAAAPAIAHRALDDDSAMERSSFCALAVPAAQVAPFLPEGLQLDTFQGSAWIGVVPLWMDRINFRGVPSVPGRRAFLRCISAPMFAISAPILRASISSQWMRQPAGRRRRRG